MNTQGTVAVNAARKAVYDKVESQIHTFEAQLATLKAKAESAKADAEIKALANLATAKVTLDRKVAELKKTGETTFQQAKGIFAGALSIAAAAIPKRVGTRKQDLGQSSKKDRRRC